MLKNFKTYQLALGFYQKARLLKLPYAMKEEDANKRPKRSIDRLFVYLSSSVALNLAEGDSRRTRADRRRLFNIALASMRECQAIIELESLQSIESEADNLARHLFCLCRALE